MREIKFRIWDKQANKFFYMLPLEHHFSWPRFQVQQYTGLKDKNGKEIYEGDVCRITEEYEDSCCGNEFEYIGFVCWGVGKWRFKDNVSRCLGAPDWTKHSNLGDWRAGFEVIGNIYEHKHLLEAK